MLRRVRDQVAKRLAIPILRRTVIATESRSRFTGEVNERPVEYRFVFDCLNSVNPRTVLDVGSGTSSLPHAIWMCGFEVDAIDNVRDYWRRGLLNRHWNVVNADVRALGRNGRYDLVTCVSTLEHIDDPDAAVAGMCAALATGGHLLVTVPYNESTYVPNAYDLPGSGYGQDFPFVTQVFSRAEIDRWTTANGLAIVEQEYWRIFSGEFWTQGEQVYPRVRATKDEPHHLTCLLFRAGG